MWISERKSVCFRIDDKGLLNSRKEIFARKFDYVIDKDIIFNLRDRITN